MAKEKTTIMVIDAGSASFRVVAAQLVAGGEIELLSSGEAPSLGVQRGVVTSIDDASFAMRAAMEDAGLDGKNRELEVYAIVGGKHLSSANHAGDVDVSRSDNLVTERDVNRALDASNAFEATEDRRMLHAFPRTFRVDGYLCRRNPIGMSGPTVGAESHLITAEASAIRSLKKAAQMAGRELDGFIAAPVAASQAVLSPEEKEEGVVLIDIGAGTTDVMGFHNGVPFHTSVLPVGGNQITNDLAVALNTSQHVAQRLYNQEGSGDIRGIGRAEELTVQCFGLTGTRNLRRSFLNEVIHLRLTEILRMGYMRAKNADRDLPPEASVVLTGGVANLQGMQALAEKTLERTVRIGNPVDNPTVDDELANPAMATAIGAVRLAADPTFEIRRARRAEPQRGFHLLPQLQGIRARLAG